MSSNTNAADINEIYLGYFLAGESWFDKDAKTQVERKAAIVSKKDYDDQVAKAKAMANEVQRWAKSNGYKGSIGRVFWTARPGSMSSAVGRPVDQRKNPSDILIKFADGPADGFLGISAKSTKGRTDIGFKNPGLGTIEKALGINLSGIHEEAVRIICEKYKLSPNATKRKVEIRANKKIQEATQEFGSQTLAKMRDAMYNRVSSMSNKELVDFILNNWLDASDTLYPPYIKVTGMGSKEPYTAKVDDPLRNPKLEAVIKDTLKVEKVGNETIGVTAGGKRILKMRFKFESEKLATSVKMTGDPW